MDTNSIVLVLISISIVISAIGGIMYKVKFCKSCCCTCENLDVETQPPPDPNTGINTIAKAIWAKK